MTCEIGQDCNQQMVRWLLDNIAVLHGMVLSAIVL